MKKLMMVMSAVLLALGASAATEIVDGVTWNYSVSNGKASVYKGSSSPAIPIVTTGALTIPATLGGYTVTGIGAYAFYKCNGLTSVTIPDSVTSIGGRAFLDCSGLKSVTIPEGITGIGDYAFSGCSGLTSVTIPSSVTSIGSSAFHGCGGMTEFVVDEANSNYSSLNGLLCSKDGKNLIAGVNGNVTIPSSVTSIGSSAFYGCRGLTSVTIPSSVMRIWSSAFENCSGLMSVTIPSSVTSIGSYAFENCRGLISVTIPEGVTSIEEYTFQGCDGLISVLIPASVTSIGRDAFHGCSGLMSVTIPSSVTSIGSYAFESCRGLTSVEFLGPPPDNVRNSYLLSSCVLILPREYGAQWRVVCDSYFGGIYFFAGYGQGEKPVVEIVSAEIRENDPTVMDVVYKVKSPKPTVKVRALAFQDGERSFAKVVRPTEFIEDTAKNIGDAITANEEHKLSWRVSADWKVDLAKVKFEVLVSEGDLLPLELTTIPKVGEHAAVEISWNAVSEQQVFDALLWMYADGDEGLMLSDGVLKNGTSQLVYKTGHLSADAIGYVYGKMGFSVLSGDELKYANEMTRLGLSPSGVRQYAWREVND